MILINTSSKSKFLIVLSNLLSIKRENFKVNKGLLKYFNGAINKGSRTFFEKGS